MIAQAGTYYLWVYDDDYYQGGDYNFTLQKVNPPVNAVEVVYGEIKSGTIGVSAEVDIYRFAANAGDSVVMPIVQTSGSAYFNPTVRLYDSAGALVTTKGVDYYGELVQVIAQAGTYYLWVYDDDYYQGGDYNFTLQKVNPPVNAVEVVYGEIKSGTIGVSAEVDIYRFAANAGDSVVMPIVQTSGSAYFNPTVRLYDSAGALVTTKGVDYYGELVQVIAQAGTYYLWVYDDDYYQGGDYNFTLQKVNPPVNAVEVVYGEIKSGTIGVSAEVDIYRFAANAGDSVVMPIVQTSGSAYFNPTVRLYDSAGALVTTKGVDYYGELVQVIAQAGTYYLWVYDDDYYQGGDYNFTLQKVNPPVNAVEVVYGEIKSGTIGVSAEVDIYRFAANAGDSVVMPIVQTSGSAYFNPTVRLYDSAGALVTTKGVDYYGELVQVIAQAGTYYLWVYDDDYYQGGGYQFTLTLNPCRRSALRRRRTARVWSRALRCRSARRRPITEPLRPSHLWSMGWSRRPSRRPLTVLIFLSRPASPLLSSMSQRWIITAPAPRLRVRFP